MEDVLLYVIPLLLTFGIGFLLKSPIYQKGKAVAGLVVRAMEDDKITAEEAKTIYEAIKGLLK